MEIRRLNTIRGIAALIVVTSHFSNSSALWDKMLGQGAGQIGVMLFFILSGFLITHLYWDKRPAAKNIVSYLAARFARVGPLYLFVVFFSFTTPYAYNLPNFRTLLSHLLFLHGEEVLWSIPPEIQFYALFALAWVFKASIHKILPIALTGSLIAAYCLNLPTTPKVILSFPVSNSIVKALPFFITGCILGRLFLFRDRLKPFQHSWYLISLLVIPLLYPKIFKAIFGFDHALWTSIGILAAVTFVFFSLVFLVPDRNRFLEHRFGDFFGGISYSLYLWHEPILGMLSRWGWVIHGICSLFLTIIFASIVSWVSLRIIESPARRAIRCAVGRRLSIDDGK